MSEYMTVCRASDLGPGDIVPVEVDGVDIVVYRSGDDYYASQRRCLHQGADLSEGLVSRGFLICALHGWRFHAATGRHEIAAENCLAMYRVRVVGDDVQVDPTPIRNGGAAPGEQP